MWHSRRSIPRGAIVEGMEGGEADQEVVILTEGVEGDVAE